MLFKNWKLFLPLLIIAVLLDALLVGIMEQADYAQYQEILDETSVQVAGGDIGSVAKAGLLLISTITTAISTQLSETFFTERASLWKCSFPMIPALL